MTPSVFRGEVLGKVRPDEGGLEQPRAEQVEDGGAARPRHGHGRGPEAGLVLGQRPRHGAQHEGGGGGHEGHPADGQKEINM